jgi:hypothetical protein
MAIKKVKRFFTLLLTQRRREAINGTRPEALEEKLKEAEKPSEEWINHQIAMQKRAMIQQMIIAAQNEVFVMELKAKFFQGQTIRVEDHRPLAKQIAEIKSQIGMSEAWLSFLTSELKELDKSVDRM